MEKGKPMEIKNVTYSKFIELSGIEQIKYIQLLSISKKANKPINHIGLSSPFDYDGNVKGIEFWTVKNIQSMEVEILHSLSWLQYIEEWDKSKMAQVGNLGIVGAWQQAIFIRDTLTELHGLEVNALGGSPTSEQIQAGIDEFDKFGAYNQLFELQKILRYSLDDCKKMAYMEAFTVLSHASTSHRFERRLNNILNPSR